MMSFNPHLILNILLFLLEHKLMGNLMEIICKNRKFIFRFTYVSSLNKEMKPSFFLFTNFINIHLNDLNDLNFNDVDVCNLNVLFFYQSFFNFMKHFLNYFCEIKKFDFNSFFTRVIFVIF